MNAFVEEFQISQPSNKVLSQPLSQNSANHKINGASQPLSNSKSPMDLRRMTNTPLSFSQYSSSESVSVSEDSCRYIDTVQGMTFLNSKQVPLPSMEHAPSRYYNLEQLPGIDFMEAAQGSSQFSSIHLSFLDAISNQLPPNRVSISHQESTMHSVLTNSHNQTAATVVHGRNNARMEIATTLADVANENTASSYSLPKVNETVAINSRRFSKSSISINAILI